MQTGRGFLLHPSPLLERATKGPAQILWGRSAVGSKQGRLERDPVSCFGSGSSAEGIQWSALQSAPHAQERQELVFIKHLLCIA